MGNWFSTIALVSWPLVALCLYLKRPLTQATMWTVLAAQMLLPVGEVIKFKMIPQFDKDTIPCLCILVGCLVVARRGLKLFRGFGLTEVLIVMYLISPIITSELNGDALVFGDRILPGVGLYDAISALESSFILLIPFLIGRQFLRDAATTREIMLVLVLAALVYSLPMLFEIRFAPQLHYWVYGYSPSEFSQSVRDGGYRPMVFMGHGLLAALFAMMSAVAAAALWRTRTPIHTPLQTLPPGRVTAYLSLVLILYKSLGAAIYAIVLIPLVRWTRPKLQMRIATALVAITLLYPLLSTFKLFPHQLLLETADLISPERAFSLQIRFINEAQLLDHALERPMFGWGRYGRNRVYNAETGTDDSVTDGLWIITIGGFGLFGFVAQFGLLTTGVFRSTVALRFAESREEQILLAALALIVAVNIVDLIPNSGLQPWSWLLAGALLGRAEALRALAKQKSRQARARVGVASPRPAAVNARIL
jgi:hypothetical protein